MKAARSIFSRDPSVANYHEQDFALIHPTLEVRPKINAKRDGIDVFEDLLFSEVLYQPIIDAASYVGAIVTAI